MKIRNYNLMHYVITYTKSSLIYILYIFVFNFFINANIFILLKIILEIIIIIDIFTF